MNYFLSHVIICLNFTIFNEITRICQRRATKWMKGKKINISLLTQYLDLKKFTDTKTNFL